MVADKKNGDHRVDPELHKLSRITRECRKEAFQAHETLEILEVGCVRITRLGWSDLWEGMGSSGT